MLVWKGFGEVMLCYLLVVLVVEVVEGIVGKGSWVVGI